MCWDCDREVAIDTPIANVVSGSEESARLVGMLPLGNLTAHELPVELDQ